MAKIDLSTITEPISEEQPCGPDLDMEFDMDFMNLMAELEGALPTSYFRFEAPSFDFDGFYRRIAEQLEKSHDIRLLVPLVKLHILQGDLAGSAESMDAIRKLLKTFWSDAHPQAMDGDFGLRTGQLFTLDDNPNMVLPLQHAAIIRSRRHGAITLRKWQVAQGDVNPREGEDTLDSNAIMTALSEAEAADIEKVVASLELMKDALAEIQKTMIAEAGYDNAVTLERLPQSIDAMLELIGNATGVGEAAEAGEGTEEGAEGGQGAVLGTIVLPPGAVGTRAEVKEVLEIAHRYFLRKEPSSPAQILLREAIGAVEKGFYSLVYDLVPSQASYSMFRLGRDPFFELSVNDMNSRNPAPEIPAEDEASEAYAETGMGDDESVSEEAGDPETGAEDVGDGPRPEETADGEQTAEMEVAEEVSAEEPAPEEDAAQEEPQDAASADQPAEEETAEAPAEPEEQTEEEPEEAPPPGPKFWANTRPEAVSLMEKVIAYYKVAEPTSPVPLLLDQAIKMSSKNFMDLLVDVLPEGTLKRRENG